MKGYWQRRTRRRSAIRDGWFHTGDLARRDEDGFYFIVDRKKDMIIRGGYNVYPREIEEVLYEHPAVLHAAVIGIPHPVHGEEVGAAVELRAGRRSDRGGAARLRQGAGGGLQVPAARVVGTASDRPDRQDPQAGDRGACRGDGEGAAVSAAAAPEGRGSSVDADGEVAAPLDLLLTDAALGPTRRFFPGVSGLRFARALTAQPRLLAARVGGLAGELGRVVVGTSQVAPSRRDRRFTDPAWTQNPLLRRAVQGYLATATTVAGLVEDVPTELARHRADAVRRRPTSSTRWRRATTRCSARPRGRP